ncbi:polyketide synthase module [Phaeosphaeria sp. MPI-PUGE-AT-0046c]|nr:polyketide synthase module [Phaeosphaeria sp. MPI-PUGE-AT-0046c]
MEADNSEWATEPIAIIGMSCKFSGGASNPDKLWDLMAAGKTGWSEIPVDRYDLKGIYHHNHERTSTTHVKGGHFIDEDVAAFDAAFFNYSAEMAQVVDPQFRLQLESTYEALENAGLSLPQVMGSQTSVFAGVFTHDYQDGMIRDEDRLPRFNVVGTWSPMSSNRISHFFDFRGASMTLETGCSTTLVALHQAIQTLRNREADMSVVTGANVMLNPDTFKAIGSLGMLSPDGRSYAFDSRGNGYGRGEGVGTVIIKRLSDALAANDPIRAVIRETGVNQDGKTDTITTPSGDAQVALMRECYTRAGLDPRGTQYFEAHGTGTPAGDPIEASAMAAIFADGEGREDEANYLRIGSVKTNVGHTEAASGLAAIIKGVLCLEKGLIPPSVNFEKPNPKLKLDEWRLKIVTEMQPWPQSLTNGPKRLSVNNFGYGGTNAHVILESADAWVDTPDLDPRADGLNKTSNGNVLTNGKHSSLSTTDNTKVLLVSARDERGCQQAVSDLKLYLEKHRSLARQASEQLLRQLSYTLSERRTKFQWIAAHQVRIESDGTLDSAIQAFESPRFKPRRNPSEVPRIGMVFTGQGAQWNAMGRELLDSYPVFRQSIEEADAYLHDLGADWSLFEELNRDAKTTKVHSTTISIPVCVALQIALVRLLEAWGIKPTAVTSHSSGEIAAAYAVGAITHRQAMATAYHRAALAADDSLRPAGAPKGAMAAVGLGAEDVQVYLDRLSKVNGGAGIACVNSPQSVTISGDSDAVQEMEDLCEQDGVFARRLKVQQAYHSHHMLTFSELYRERLRKEMARDVVKTNNKALHEDPEELQVKFSSAVTGGRVTSSKEIASPDHWVGSLVQPVEFVDAFTDMVLGDLEDPTGRSVDVLLEVGPHTALGGPIKEILALPEFEGIDLPYMGCLVRNEHAGDCMRAAAINLLHQGQPLVMSQINFPDSTDEDDTTDVLTDLPSYPWNHTMRHFQEARVNRAIRERAQPPHELLGMPIPGNDPSSAVWRRMLRVSETPWIRDHMIQGSILYPGAGYICLAIEAAKQLEQNRAPSKTSGSISGFRLRDIKFLFALIVPDNSDGAEIRTTLRDVPEREAGERGWRRFEVSSVTLDNKWTLHSQGMIMVEREITATKSVERRPLSIYTRNKDPQDLFANLRARGIYHGPLFQNTTNIVQDGREARSLCDITIRHEASSDTDPVTAAQDTLLHPITLDAIVVAFYSALPSVGALQEDPKLPRSIASMWVSSNISNENGRTLSCDTSLLKDDLRSGVVDVSVVDEQENTMVLQIQALECASLGRGSGATARQDAALKGSTAATSKWLQEVCSKLIWRPDLSIRQPMAIEQIKKQLTALDSVTSQLSTLLHHVAHKKPIGRILVVGNGMSDPATRLLLETFGTADMPLSASWQITEPSPESLEQTRSQLSDWEEQLEFSQFDTEQSPNKQKLAAESYDIIVAPHTINTVKSVSDALSNVRSLLVPGGTLLLAESVQGEINEIVHEKALQDAGFNGIDVEVYDSETSSTRTNKIVMSTVPVPEIVKPDLGKSNARETFAIVSSSKTPSTPAFIETLSEALKNVGAISVEHIVLEESDVDTYKSKICVFLGEMSDPMLANLDAVSMEGIRAMVTQCNGLLWITSGGAVNNECPDQAVSQGFLRVLRNEYNGRRYLSLDLDPTSSNADATVSTIVHVMEQGFGYAENSNEATEFEYAERDGVLLIPRVYKDGQYNDMVVGRLEPSWGEAPHTYKDDGKHTDAAANIPLGPLFQKERPLRLEVGIPGHIDTLAYVDETRSSSPELSTLDLVEIRPQAYGLCSRDVMAAMGQLKDQSMGFECAGIVTGAGSEAQAKGFSIGDRVMALSVGSSFASSVRVPWHSVVRVPDNMDLQQAATLPLAFTLAYSGLYDTAHMAPGQSLLVHAASGSIGQAAIMLAKHLGVTDIYATAGTKEKRDFIQQQYDIPAKRIFSSRNASFKEAILRVTDGRGVDVVLNTLPSTLLQASLDAIAPLGYLVDIGKRDMEANSLIALESFSRGISMVTLDITTILSRRGPHVAHMLGEMIGLINTRALRPIQPITLHSMREVQTAFQSVQSGNHMGKVVLLAGSDEQVHVVPRPTGATPRQQLRPDATYLVVGGVGGIGRSIAHWLVDHGARNLILLSRSAGDLDLEKNQHTDGALFVQELRNMGCRVMPVSCDVSLASELAIALRTCEDAGLPPVRGVVQGAMLLRDAIFEQMTLAEWHEGLRPKLDGTWNLHTEFSQRDSLDFFVMLSSVSGIVGIMSQTNYAAGGSYEDAMARWRQSRGLPGVAIDLGPISDIGFVSKTAKVAERLRKDGDFTMLDEDIVLRALNAAVLHPLGRSSQIIVGLNSTPGPQWDVNGRSQLGRDARFLALRPRTKASRAGAAQGEGGGASLAAQLTEAGDRQEGAQLIGTAIAAKLADIFMTPVAEIDLSKPPAHYGVDSLIAVELRNMLVLQAAADISIFDILQIGSLAALASTVAEKSRHLEAAE